MSIFALLAGGTGGHLFPAMALAQELRRRGHEIHLVTDHRVASYGREFPAREIHIVPAATPSGRNPLAMAGAALTIATGSAVALAALRRIRPQAVVGFGGYPTFPPFLAARMLRIPGLLHEQNAVLGRANRALARLADVLALSFAETRFADSVACRKIVTGNPVRDSVRAASALAYERPTDSGRLRLLVFGGSQGARAFADLVPPAVALIPEELRARLDVTQQCRSEDLERVTAAYRQAKVNVELAAFFDDLPARMAHSHLVVARSGASTVAELGVLGRPAILVPLPGSIDADQRNNALVLDRAGAGWLAEQDTLSPSSLARRLESLFEDTAGLAAAASAASGLGQPDAVKGLADIAETLAGRSGKGQPQ